MVQDLPRHLPDILLHSGAAFTCCQCLPESSSCSLQACCLFRCLQQGTSLLNVVAVAGSSGPHGGTQLDYPLSKRTEEDHKTPYPSCLDRNPTPAGLCETSQYRKAMDYSLHCHTIFSSAAVVLGCQSTFEESLRWNKLNNCKDKKQYSVQFLNAAIVPSADVSLSLSQSSLFSLFHFDCRGTVLQYSGTTLTSHSNPRLCKWFLQCTCCCLVANVIEFHFRKFFPCCIVIQAGVQLCLETL